MLNFHSNVILHMSTIYTTYKLTKSHKIVLGGLTDSNCLVQGPDTQYGAQKKVRTKNEHRPKLYFLFKNIKDVNNNNFKNSGHQT